MRIKPGDRVRVIGSESDIESHLIGKIGTAVGPIEVWHSTVCVAFDEYIDGHDLAGRCKDGYGWVCNMTDLERIAINNKGEDLLKMFECDA